MKPGQIVTLGLPFDRHSSFLRGAAGAPDAIREAFHSESANYYSENGYDLQHSDRLVDLGDLSIDDYFDIEAGIKKILAQKAIPVLLGGDHSVTYPVMRAFRQHHSRLTVIQLDAHADLYEEFQGNPYSHACPFARIMEDKLVTRLIQVGVRTLTEEQRKIGERYGVETYEMRHWGRLQDLRLQGPVYLSLDMDVLEPGLAPGISHYEPGGMSPRDVIGIIQQIKAPLVGADIVEYNPARDIQHMTAMVAAKFYREICGKILAQPNPAS